LGKSKIIRRNKQHKIIVETRNVNTVIKYLNLTRELASLLNSESKSRYKQRGWLERVERNTEKEERDK